MKRFQISLRLLLLIVALFAVCFAWLGAQLDLRRADVDRMRIDLEAQIGHEEWRYKFELWQLADTRKAGPSERPYYNIEIAYSSNTLNKIGCNIASLRKQLDDLEP